MCTLRTIYDTIAYRKKMDTAIRVSGGQESRLYFMKENNCKMTELPADELPYEKCINKGAEVLSDAELLAVILRTGSKGINALELSRKILDAGAPRNGLLGLYHMTARELGQRIMNDISEKVGVRATCGIGTNLYLTKIALDITAKHATDFIGELDEESYRRSLWRHRPLTDFWRIGAGTAKKLANYGIYTMEDIAKTDEDFLYRLFGVDAELLIDHAWGREPVMIADIKAYKPGTNSITNGQVLACDYNYTDGELIIKEMTDLLCLDLVAKKLVCKSITLHVGYSNQLNLNPAHGTVSFNDETNSDMAIIPEVVRPYRRIVNPAFAIRRVNITCNHVVPEEYHQYSFFADAATLEKNHKVQEAVVEIKNKFGKNAILKGMNLEKAATTMERNQQIGGHKAGERDK